MNEQEKEESINQKAHKIHELRAEIKVLNNVKRELKTPKTKDGVFVEMPDLENDNVFCVNATSDAQKLENTLVGHKVVNSQLALGQLFSTEKACKGNILRLKFWQDMLKQDGASGIFRLGEINFILGYENGLYVGQNCCSCFADRVFYDTEENALNAINFAKENNTQDELKLIFMGCERYGN